jgi:hypothetical protein
VPDSPPLVEVRLESRAILRRALVLLLAFEILLVYLDVVVTFFEALEHEALHDLCNIVLEGSLAAWFSSVQTLVVALITALIGVRVAAEPGARRRAVAWWIVAGFFAYMAMDDGSSLHEAVATAIEDAWREAAAAGEPGVLARALQAFPSYPWQVLLLPALGALGLFTAWWSVREMSRRSYRRLVLAGFACFALAVGIDFVEGLETPYRNLGAAWSLGEDTVPHASGIVEELIEMLGTTFLLYAYLAYLLDLCRDIRVRVVADDRRSWGSHGGIAP